MHLKSSFVLVALFWKVHLVVGPKWSGFSRSARYVSFTRATNYFIMLVQFVEDEGDVVFYKNSYGVAQMRPTFSDGAANDSGIELDK